MKIKTYNNGLRLVVNKKNDTDTVSFNILVGVGSKDEDENYLGTAHFLEHMFFKSTKTMSYDEILGKLDELGVSHNAYTSMIKTCYYFKCLSSVFGETVGLFSDMFFNNSFNKKEIENEKKVILEEYKMDEDDQTKKAITNAFEDMFCGMPFGHNIIGTPTSIKTMTLEKLVSFKKKYVPNKVVISVSGKVSFRYVNKLVKKYFVDRFIYKNDNEILQINCYEDKIKRKFVSKQKDNKQSIVYILYNFGEMSFKERTILNIYFSILGYGMSSKLFAEIRSKRGLVYDIDAGATSIGKNMMAEILFATSNENVADAIVAVKEMLERCASGEIFEAELIRAKNKFIANLSYGMESNSGIANTNGNELLTKGFIRPDIEIEREIKAASLQDVILMAKKVINNKKFVVSSVGKCKKLDLKLFNF